MSVAPDTIEYSTCPEGRRDWFYTLFGCCFAKNVIDYFDKKIYHNVLWFRYTTDGNKCEGFAIKDMEPYALDEDVYGPECIVFCALCMRFMRINICCNYCRHNK